MTRQDPMRNFRFRLEIDGFESAGFSEVSIGPASIDVIEYREGSDPPHVRKLSGLRKFSNLTLKRGMTNSLELFDWYRQVVTAAGPSRRKVVIVVTDESGADQARFVVSDAWPVKYDAGNLNARGNEVFIEELELANEGIERVS